MQGEGSGAVKANANGKKQMDVRVRRNAAEEHKADAKSPGRVLRSTKNKETLVPLEAGARLEDNIE
ncbi:hypothetical protein LTR36_002445 [Oleoguttula mirabilis]|uniref:Uncharacterized protein n=1 Tax=Oleoguttula mirabilis TaxID=1507867 RepID=A0AAV9JLJ0_9PEZI|nr:hypothetical protein LTR36_002445 [Oleoguttula mirabilis]